MKVCFVEKRGLGLMKRRGRRQEGKEAGVGGGRRGRRQEGKEAGGEGDRPLSPSGTSQRSSVHLSIILLMFSQKF